MKGDNPWADWHPDKYLALLQVAKDSPEFKRVLIDDLQRCIDGDILGDQCALWTCDIPCRTQRHGRYYYNGMPMKPYRLLWDLHYGCLPIGIYACHQCLSKGQCCNLNHLKPGDGFDNWADTHWQNSNYKGPTVRDAFNLWCTGINPAPDRISRYQMKCVMECEGYWAWIFADTDEAARKRPAYGLPREMPPRADYTLPPRPPRSHSQKKERKKRLRIASLE